jgi:hypothetical protein
MLAITHADEKANANSALKNIRKIHLTRYSSLTLLLCCRAAAIAFAPSSPIPLLSCKTHVGPHARRRKSKREFSTKQTSTKFSLQGLESARCCCVAERQQSPSLPRRQLRCRTAKLMLAITHADEKANANSALNKHPQNSSYKVQLLHAAVVLQSGSNRLRSLVADSVTVLQNSCWPSRTPTTKQARIQH